MPLRSVSLDHVNANTRLDPSRGNFVWIGSTVSVLGIILLVLPFSIIVLTTVAPTRTLRLFDTALGYDLHVVPNMGLKNGYYCLVTFSQVRMQQIDKLYDILTDKSSRKRYSIMTAPPNRSSSKLSGISETSVLLLTQL